MWTFEFSLMMFLIIIFISNAISVISKGKISIQFALGIISIMGFYFGWLQQDFIELSKMKDVGFIAFNVLIIHSGTMIDLKRLKKNPNVIKISLFGLAVVTLVVGLGLSPIVGKNLAFSIPGPMMGGGATAAITSVMLLDIDTRISVFPWLIFMVQSFVSVPLVAWALKKEVSHRVILPEPRIRVEERTSGRKLYDVWPRGFKNPAYYIGILMIAAVFNKWLNISVLANINLHMSVTGIVIGFLLGHFGIVERGPLNKSDSMGLLMLGLMSLLVLTISKTPTVGIVYLIMPLILAVILSSVCLIIVSLIASKYYKMSIYKTIATTFSCMIGFPMNIVVVKGIASSITNLDEAKYFEIEWINNLSITAVLITNGLSIIVSSLMVVQLY
jgi:hypothetical protein